VYDIWNASSSIYQIAIDEHGRKLGPTEELPLSEGDSHTSPFVSRDGRWMAFNSAVAGQPPRTLLRDFVTGTDHLLDDIGRSPNEYYTTTISPDGTNVIFTRDCPRDTFPDGPTDCGFLIASSNGRAEKICEICNPRGFSSDGSVVLVQKYASSGPDRIFALDLRTRTQRLFLSDPAAPLYHPFFSWDDRWVVFKRMQPGDFGPSQLLIAPVRNGSAAGAKEWIAVTAGTYNDDKPQFSADGNTLFYMSTRDGYLCIWGQKLNARTRHPVGAPFWFEHFHNLAGSAGTLKPAMSDLSVARNKMLINLPQIASDIWITKMP
jgi:Tol biopolymer transport system component